MAAAAADSPHAGGLSPLTDGLPTSAVGKSVVVIASAVSGKGDRRMMTGTGPPPFAP